MGDPSEIEKNKLYKQLFVLFEEELLEIFEYVAPTDDNNNAYWNKIHGLLLRIWAECQNIAYELALQITKNETDDIEWISSWSCYREYLDWKLSLKWKAIQFVWYLESWKQNYIKPFEDTEDSEWNNIWEWWQHYNKLKHEKINWYKKCCLKDVVYALWTYYILLQYLILWYNNISRCGNGQITNSTKDVWIKSSIFYPTFCYHRKSLDLDVNWYVWVINEDKIPLFESFLNESNDVIITHHNLNKDNCLYRVYLNIDSFVAPNSLRESLQRGLPIIPKTYILQPVFSFTNKKYNN